MNAARHSPLVARVAKAISRWRWDQKTNEPWERLKPSVQHAYLEQAQAALDACQAQRLLDTLREYIASAYQCTEAGGDDVAAMLRFGEADKAARALVAEFGDELACPSPSEHSDSAEARFRLRFEADKAGDMTEEEWGQWVDRLPKDEFWAMLELGLSEAK